MGLRLGVASVWSVSWWWTFQDQEAAVAGVNQRLRRRKRIEALARKVEEARIEAETLVELEGLVRDDHAALRTAAGHLGWADKVLSVYTGRRT